MSIAIIPKPMRMKEQDGDLIFNDKVGIVESEDTDFFINDLNFVITKFCNFKLKKVKQQININFVKDISFENEEYKLEINKDGIALTGNDSGLFYAVQTLKQIITQCKNRLPFLTISDKPRFAMRSYMLDVGRYFFKLEDIKKQIDYLSLFKINTLHLHLSEDQGFRVQINKYPNLTKVGSNRKATNWHFKKHGGFYSKDELQSLVAYAKQRNISIIPEIDMPGHTQAMLASYPYLSCFDRKLDVATHWGVKHDILCAGKASTYQFVFDIIDEIMDIFKSAYFHVGGDEAPKTRWKLCPHCQKKMKEEGLKDENELQAYFISKVANYIMSKGAKVIMWNEAEFTTGINSDIIWEYWGGGLPVEKMTDVVKSGKFVINGDSRPYYFDLPYSMNSLKEVYHHNPVFKGLTKDEEKQIIALECPLWSEFVPNQKRAEYLTFPRLCAFSSTAWENGEKDYSAFVQNFNQNKALLDCYGIRYAKDSDHNPTGLKSKIMTLWFKRAMFYWHGLHNLIDNAKVKKMALKKIKKD